jgi:alternate signal-mediated exported protein
MASKSKKRRRVLGASCILAALIIAGSSFAWFTSKDEVTNRLSANADYGVSIVESFAPPENWLPGQEVNKDVYAVNTGNVAAFVEETVSGALTITKEVADGATPTADSIKLTKAERYVVEAGAYLAYAPAASNIEKGSKVVSMIPDSADLNAYEANNDPLTDFTPDAAGLYVFRRSIGVDKDTQLETFKYDGYYFDGQDYYQITDLKVVPDKASYAGDNDFTDGNLKEASAKCVKEVTETVNPVSLAYEEKTADHPNRLVATYDTGMKADDVQTLSKNYDDALIAYQEALEEYNAAVRDNNTAEGTVSTDKTNLQTALENLLAAQKTLKEKTDALTAAQKAKTDADNAKTAAQKAVDDAKVALYGNKEGGTVALTATAGGETGNYTAGSLYGKYKAAETADNEAQTAVDNAKIDLYGHKDGSDAQSTGDETGAAGKYTTNSKYGKWKAASDAVAAAEDDDRNAYLEYIYNSQGLTGAGTDEEKREAAKAWLLTKKYDDLKTLSISNTQVGYNYHQLLVAEKKAKEELDKAQNTYNEKVAVKAQTAQRLADAKKAYEDAMVELYGNSAGGETDKTNNTNGEAGKYTATSTFGKLKKAEDDVTAAENNVTTKQNEYDQAMENLYGHKKGGTSGLTENASGEENKYTAGSVYGKFKEAETKYKESVEAASGNPSTSTRLIDAQNNLAKATQTLNEAKAAYESAYDSENPDKGVLKININLSDDVVTNGNTADKWQLLPNPVSGDVAYFYYTSILGAGETSAQLIDSVELDSSVTEDMFKRFDFDLNVALKSAQIAMANDGKTILTDAAAELDANATLATPTDVNTAINWTLK